MTWNQFRTQIEAARAIPGADGARQIARVYADLNRDHSGGGYKVGTYPVDTMRILRDLGGELGPAYKVRRCAPWADVGPPDYVITHADYEEALAFLDAIGDEVWERVVGSQGRDEFARLTVDAGQEIEDAWAEALLNAATL